MCACVILLLLLFPYLAYLYAVIFFAGLVIMDVVIYRFRDLLRKQGKIFASRNRPKILKRKLRHVRAFVCPYMGTRVAGCVVVGGCGRSCCSSSSSGSRSSSSCSSQYGIVLRGWGLNW